MTLSELFNLRETIESRINQYWTFWSVAIFAVCGWLFTDSAQESLKNNAPIFIAIGLLFFFAANLIMLWTSTKLSISIHKEICQQVKKSELSDAFKNQIDNSSFRYRAELTIIMHLTIDFALLVFLYIKSGTL
ncbi:MAG: hypothetical protein ACNI25_08060 [Halarcobacter sp.]